MALLTSSPELEALSHDRESEACFFQEPVMPPPPSSETEQIAPPSLGDTILEKIIYYLNYPFINQKEFKVSALSLLLLIVVIIIAWLVSSYARRFLKNRVLPKSNIDVGLQYTLLRVLHYIVITIGLIYGLKVGFSIDLTSVAVILGFFVRWYWIRVAVHRVGYGLWFHTAF